MKKFLPLIYAIAIIIVFGWLVYMFWPIPVDEKPNNSQGLLLSQKCQSASGTWLGDFNECEYASKGWCEENGGEFFECESACRHDPKAEICTLQCVSVCKFNGKKTTITDFQSCVKAGNPIMESWPRQCRYQGKTYIEDIGNENEKSDLIQLDTPRPNQIISSPLQITGQARGYWFFEASFPVRLEDINGEVIAQGIAKVIKSKGDPKVSANVKEDILELTSHFPLYPDLGILK